MIRLEAASANLPRGLRELLEDIGGGENGFEGTDVHTGEATVEDYVRQCCEMPDPSKLRPGLVPQTVFWVLDAEGLAVGMVRMRHYLNDKLRLNGGHIGYFIKRDRRGRGYGTEALRLALIELSKLGEGRALLTPHADNIPSVRLIERNGGLLEDVLTDPASGTVYKRYWIELETAK